MMEAAVKDVEGEAATAGNNASNDSYQKLAQFMAKCPDTAIFRKFGTLSMLNLLRLQAELQDMEQKLKDIAEEDKASGDALRREYGSNFRTMRECKEDDDDSDNTDVLDTIQYDMLVSIGEKLKEYHKALMDAQILDRATRPTKTDFDNLQIWLNRGNGFLKGIEATVWKSENQSDFVVVRPRQSVDMFSRFLNGSLLKIYHVILGKKTASEGKVVDGFRLYKEETLTKIRDGIIVAMAAVLPTVAILALYYIHTMAYRIAAVVLLTTFFAMAVAVFTQADKFGVFSATAAFAAVEVVYIGSSSL